MEQPVFEVCAESIESAQAAVAGGADRIELCAHLADGGLTPPLDRIKAAVTALSAPLHVMVRPRGESYACTADGFALMRRQVTQIREAGAAGVVFGVLLPNRRIDVDRGRALVELARPMQVTFHRAFDLVPDLAEGLEAVILTGADCLLTSGGAPDVLTGADAIARLHRQANGRLHVMAGGGLTVSNLAEVVGRTGVSYLHGSLTRDWTGDLVAGSAALENNVREALRIFRSARAMEIEGRPAPSSLAPHSF